MSTFYESKYQKTQEGEVKCLHRSLPFVSSIWIYGRFIVSDIKLLSMSFEANAVIIYLYNKLFLPKPNFLTISGFDLWPRIIKIVTIFDFYDNYILIPLVFIFQMIYNIGVYFSGTLNLPKTSSGCSTIRKYLILRSEIHLIYG